MESKVNYALVGAFVLILGAAAIAAALWLASGGGLQKKYDFYLAKFGESVAGLNLNAPVRYRGVDVGRVREIAIDPADPDLVRLALAIERGTPIRENTVAVLKPVGLTGIVFVELEGSSLDSPPRLVVPPEKYPVIPTRPSLTARLENVLSNAFAKLDTASDSINRILSPENQEAFGSTLASLAEISRTVAARKEEIDRGLRQAARTLDNSARLSEQLGPVVGRIDRAAGAVEKMGDDVARNSVGIGKTVDALGGDVRRFTVDTLPELQLLLAEMNVLTRSLRRLIDQTERNPRSFLFGRPPVMEGPGEGAAERNGR